MTEDLNESLEALVTRYQEKLAQKDAEIEALSQDLLAFSTILVSRGELKPLPENDEDWGQRWVI